MRITALLLAIFLSHCSPAAVPESDPGRGPWEQYASPEEAGFSSSGLDEARELATTLGSAAVFVVYRGRVLVAWGDVERRLMVHSVRKSLLGALIGIHLAAGRLSLDDTLEGLGIDDLQPLTPTEKQATLRDLLRSMSGVYHPAADEPPSMAASRPDRGSSAPGERFWYNNWDFNVLAYILEQRADVRLFEDFKQRIAVPLGMQDYRVRDGHYRLEPRKSRYPSYPFRMSARDLARFGQLYLQGGRWSGRQVVPEKWVRDSTRKQAKSEGYGYLWWIFKGMKSEQPLNRYDKFAALGTGAQMILVIPEAQLVFVHRSDTDHDRLVTDIDAARIANKILRARIGKPAAGPALKPVAVEPLSELPPPVPDREAVPLDPELARALVGLYDVSPETTAELFLWNDRLFVQATGTQEIELFAESEDRLFAKAANLVIDIERDEDGAIDRLVARYGARTMVATRRKP